jgi:hypothetical protein
MDNSPQEAVTTGLAPQAPSPQTPPAAEAAPPSEPIKVSIPDDLTVRVSEINHPEAVAAAQQAAPATPQQNFGRDIQEQAEADNLKRDFLGRLAAAQHPAPAPYVPPPVSERIAEQTRQEIEAGRRTVAMHEERQKFRPKPVADPREGSTKSILRPEDFVPKFHQGHVPTNSYRPA